ncbi:hypothetical protein FHS27_002228 [Rhodopirellula rubra]|uniref:Secreted protein n=1 Tax=Aporhodopirellula rubra TaxID=980271 RepID=A0A7W5DY78_9BACT|nr:YdjY domain-containing protein [Aporhodopirellula rubra]MBB3206419.1 hypothetical protein [Aporhodopirellula rubra]
MKSLLTFPLSLVLVLGLISSGCSRKPVEQEHPAPRTMEASDAAPAALDASDAEPQADLDSATTGSDTAQTPANETTTEEQPAAESTAAQDASGETSSSSTTLDDTPKRMLPNAATDSTTQSTANGDSPKEDDAAMADDESPDVGEGLDDDDDYEIDPEILAHIEAQRAALRRIADTYAPPPGAKQLGQQPDLWVDLKAKRVYIDGYVTMTRGPLEMLACPVGTKEHESVIAVFAKSSEVHAALLAIGAQSGTPVRWDPEFLPPTGQTISVWVMWRKPVQTDAPENSDPNAEDSDTEAPSVAERFIPSDQFSVADARTWVRNMESKKELAEPWVFAGSGFWSDPEDGTEHYSANAGDMICVSNFSTAMLDVPFNSSADAGNLMFEPFTERLPQRGTPVRLVLVPQPIPSDTPQPEPAVDPAAPPEASQLPIPQRDEP